MSNQRKLGIASIVIGVIAALVFALATPIGIIVALVGLLVKGQDGGRRLEWTCLVGLALNAVVLWEVLPFLRMAYGY